MNVTRYPMKGAFKVPLSSKLPPDLASKALTRPWLVLPVFNQDTYIARVPEHYKKFYWEWKHAPKTPVHYVPEPGNFKKLPSGEVQQVENVPLRLLFPKQIHNGIWGGEAVIKGFKKEKDLRRKPHYWFPTLKTSVLYSEILDRYMSIVVTERTLKLVDENYGFDNYILKTPPGDLMSLLALKLRKEMYFTLVRETLYPDNPTKRKEILEKYKEFIIPEEEADWFGLSLREAATKQKIIEDDIPIVPLKHAFRKEFIEHLNNNKDEITKEKVESSGVSGLLSNFNPFAKK